MEKNKQTQGLDFEPDMPEAAVDILRGSGVSRSYRANQTVVNLGDEFPELFIVDKGRFSISIIDEHGNAWIYGYLSRGSTWGIKAVLTEGPAGFVFEALEESTATCVDRRTLWSLIDNDPIVRRGVILSLGRSISILLMQCLDVRSRADLDHVPR